MASLTQKRKPRARIEAKPKSNRAEPVLCVRCKKAELPVLRWEAYGGSGVCPQCDAAITADSNGAAVISSPSPQPLASSPSPLSTVTPAGIREHDPDVVPDGGTRRRGDVETRLPGDWGITIDPEFQAAQRPLTSVERQKLRDDLVVRGCLDPLIVWYEEGLEDLGRGYPQRVRAPTQTLLDGHHRYELCAQLALPVAVVELRFDNRAEALDWMREHQLGRRNLSSAERDELLARDYRAEVDRRREEKKTAPKKDGAKKPAPQNGAHVEPRQERPKAEKASQKASQVVAEKHGISPATVKRAVHGYAAREQIAQASGRSLKELLPLRRREVIELAALDEPQIAEALAGGVEAWRLGKVAADLDGAQADGKAKSTSAASRSPEKLKFEPLREWRESLTPAPEPRRGTGTQLRKRVVADRDAAVRVIEAHLAEYGARAEYEQSEHLLDAINAWRGQRKPFGAAEPKRKPR